MNKLSDDKVKTLIDCVRNKPGIYDKNNPLYKKFEWKEKTWKEIAANVDANEKDCRVAWRSLRDQFIKSMRDPVGMKKYKHYNSLLFLSDSLDLKSFYNNYADIEALEEDPVFVLSAEEFEFEPCTSHTIITTTAEPLPNLSANSPIDEPASPTVSEFAPTPLKKAKRDDDDVLSILKKLSSEMTTKKLDGTDMFFASVASTVKSYNLSISELALFQCEVLNFVTKRLEKIANHGKKATNSRKTIKGEELVVEETAFNLS